MQELDVFLAWGRSAALSSDPPALHRIQMAPALHIQMAPALLDQIHQHSSPMSIAALDIVHAVEEDYYVSGELGG